MNEDVKAYLSLMYNKVERINSTNYYALYEKGELFRYYVANDDGEIVLDFKVSSFDKIGPFILMSQIRANRSEDKITTLGQNFKLAVSENDLINLGIDQAIKLRKVYKVLYINEISCGLYAVKNERGFSAIFNRNGKQLSPFDYGVSTKTAEQGNYLLIKAVNGKRRLGSEKWITLKYDKTLDRIVNFGTEELGGNMFKTLVGFRDMELFNQTDYVSLYNGRVLKSINNQIWQLTNMTGQLIGERYGSIEECEYKLYDKPIFKVRGIETQDRCLGFVTTDGFELVSPGKFLIAVPIGSSGMFNVVESLSDKKKTFNQLEAIWDGKTQRFVQEFDSSTKYMWKRLGTSKEQLNIMLSCTRVGDKATYRFIGNDGNAYERIQDAFEFYTNGKGLYVVILYGKKYYCEIKSIKKLKVLHTEINENEHSWVKVT